MNTVHINSFLYVAKYNSLSKAATMLNYSISTIQNHIKSLELELNCKLYERTNSGIYLTENGYCFLEYAKTIMSTIEQLHMSLSPQENIIHVSATESVNTFLMSTLIKRFIKTYPYIEIEYTKSITNTIVENVSTGKCDIGFIAEPQFFSQHVKSELLSPIPLSFVASPSHPCFKKGLKESRDDNTLLCTISQPVISSMLKNTGISFSDCFSSEKNIGDLQTIKDAAYEGQVITLLPTHLLKNDLQNKKLRVIPELELDFHLNIYVVTNIIEKSIINDFLSLSHTTITQLHI